MSDQAERCIAGVLAGDTRLLARSISLVENETIAGRRILRALRDRLGRAAVVGITGAPGAGKSTLVAALIVEMRRRGRSIGVVAVDPSSPISGGAVLGDRLRMEKHVGTEGVFIRSLASRGHSGGLSRATAGVVDLLDAAGYDMVVVETVGAGQVEVAIAGLADTVAVVCPPGLGDEVQAIKAGLMEVAHIFAVTKADNPLAEMAERDLRLLLGMRELEWRPPVVRTAAHRGEGIGEFLDAIDSHQSWLRQQGACGAGRRARWVLTTEAAAAVNAALAGLDADPAFQALSEASSVGAITRTEAVARAVAMAAAILSSNCNREDSDDSRLATPR